VSSQYGREGGGRGGGGPASQRVKSMLVREEGRDVSG
jgi:hypothetical protein